MVDKSKLIECKWNEGPDWCEFQGVMYCKAGEGVPTFFIHASLNCWLGDDHGNDVLEAYLDRFDCSALFTFYKNKPEPIVFEGEVTPFLTNPNFMVVPATVPKGRYKVTLEPLP